LQHFKIHYGGDNSKLDNAGFSWHGTDNITKKNAHAKSEPHAQPALSLSYTSKIALFCI
jgi:hypothetical protein